MKRMKKRNVAVFFGGCSSEYGVSLESAYSVINSLDRGKYQPVMVGITKGGDWFHFTGNTDRIKADTWHNEADCVPALLSPNRSERKLYCLRKGGLDWICLDAAFPVLHGKNGEDGTIQGMIELAGIPLAGCGVLASALCMDKARAHALASLTGVRVPESFVFTADQPLRQAEAFANRVGYPVFVKPVKAGSSYGITKAGSEAELPSAIALALEHDESVIVEENIEGFEVGCAILGRDRPITGEVDEIELSQGFFDFTEKYTLQTSFIHVPARISPEKAAEIKETAVRIYRMLGCSGFARVDMFLTPEGEIVFNEVNTIPGLTEHSRYPGMMKAAGYTIGAVLDEIIKQAVGE